MSSFLFKGTLLRARCKTLKTSHFPRQQKKANNCFLIDKNKKQHAPTHKIRLDDDRQKITWFHGGLQKTFTIQLNHSDFQAVKRRYQAVKRHKTTAHSLALHLSKIILQNDLETPASPRRNA